MRLPQLSCLVLPLVSLPALQLVHAQDQSPSEPDVEGVWVDATSNAKAWLDSGNSLPFPVAVSPETVGMSSAHLGEADNRIEALVQQKKIAGASFSVMRNGQIVTMQTHGYSNVETEQPILADTIFRIFSQSKPINTAAFLTLIDDGLVEYTDPVSLYIPEFANLKVWDPIINGTVPLDRPVTIWHLLTHTSGLTYGFMDNTHVDQLYNQNDILNPNEDLATKIKRVTKLPLTCQPGSKWQYGLSTDVLLLIASLVTGLPVDEFLRSRLLEPLGMKDTGFYVPLWKAHKLATVYERNATTNTIHRPKPDPHNIQLVDYTKRPAYLAGGSGLVSSMTDMMKFGQMLLNKGELNGVRVLSEKTATAMVSPQLGKEFYPLAYNPNILMSDISFGYGIGVQIPYAEDARSNMVLAYGVPRLGEFSWGGGMSTNFWVSPQDKTVIVTMVQIMPYTQDLKFAAREWTYRSIDAFDMKQQARTAKPFVVASVDAASGSAAVIKEGGKEVEGKKRGLRSSSSKA